MKKIFYLATLIVCLFQTNAFAQGASNSSEVEVNPRVGTLGIGVDLGLRYNNSLGFRISNNYLAGKSDDTLGGINYDFDANFYNAGLILDYYPFQEGFRLSAGAFYSANEVDLKSRGNGPINIGLQTYTQSEYGRLEGSVETPTFAPYVGIGYNKKLGQSWGLNVDAGALIYTSQDVTLKSVGGTLSNDPVLNANISREIRDIENDTSDTYIYPVLMVGASYYF